MKEQLMLVRLDTKYCDYLRTYDDKVPYNHNEKDHDGQPDADNRHGLTGTSESSPENGEGHSKNVCSRSHDHASRTGRREGDGRLEVLHHRRQSRQLCARNGKHGREDGVRAGQHRRQAGGCCPGDDEGRRGACYPRQGRPYPEHPER